MYEYGRIVGPLWAGMIFDVNIYLPLISGILILTEMTVLASIKRKAKWFRVRISF